MLHSHGRWSYSDAADFTAQDFRQYCPAVLCRSIIESPPERVTDYDARGCSLLMRLTKALVDISALHALAFGARAHIP